MNSSRSHPMNFLSPHAINFACRFAVLGTVFLLGLASNNTVFAAQCGGFPKGWQPAEASRGSDAFHISDNLSPRDRAPNSPVPCKCQGASCSPAAPMPVPDQRLVLGSGQDGMLLRMMSFPLSPSRGEFPTAVTASLRYEVVLGVLPQ